MNSVRYLIHCKFIIFLFKIHYEGLLYEIWGWIDCLCIIRPSSKILYKNYKLAAKSYEGKCHALIALLMLIDHTCVVYSETLSELLITHLRSRFRMPPKCHGISSLIMRCLIGEILALWPFLPLQWRHNGRNDVWNHQPHDCLLNRLFTRRSREASKLRLTGLPVGKSPHKGSVMRRMCPFDDVIMANKNL